MGLLSDLEEIIVPQVIDPPTNDETIVDDITYLVGLHHTLGFYGMSPYINLEEDVVHKGTSHFSEDFSLPSFIFKEDVINDTPSQEVIVETLCPLVGSRLFPASKYCLMV